jgi:hypothetical protein
VTSENGRCLRRVAQITFLAGGLSCGSSASIDPGPDFIVSQTVFDQSYFYCHVEPDLLFAPAYRCGSGDPSKGDPNNGCHFDPSAVTGMALIDHPLIDCGGGDAPLDPTQVAAGSPAQSNYAAASLEMNRDYTTAPIYVRPSSYMGQSPAAHPRAIFAEGDGNVVMLLSTWATK